MPCQPLHRLFFALRPPAAAAAYIRRCHGGLGLAARLHVTLNILDDWPYHPAALVDRMLGIGGAVAAAPFRIVFDQLSGSRHAVVLRPSESVPALDRFQRQLAGTMAAAGVTARQGARFSPHLTLRYRGGPPFCEAADAVSWLVEEFVLIESLVGWSRHVVHGRWALEGRAQAICPTSKLPAGSGFSSSADLVAGSSQRAQSPRARTTIWRS